MTVSLSAQSTEFTYQGSLKSSGSVANGPHDFEFVLYDALSGGNQTGSTITLNGVTVTDGIFSIKLDFGSQFPGTSRYLEIHVRQTGGGAFTVLAPRQPITSSPYAIKSLNAENAANAVNATNATNAVNASTAANSFQLGGVAANQFVVTTDPRLTDARPPAAGSTNYVQNGTAQQPSTNFNISGNGTAASLNSTTQYNLGGQRMLSVSGPFSANATTATASNTFLGENAGVNTVPAATINDPTGKFNTFTGSLAGVANTAGGNNAFFGGTAGNANTTGNQNSFFGANAGRSNSTGDNNTFSGGFAGSKNTTQHENTFVGFFAGNANGTNDMTNLANFNTFVGSQSGIANTTGGNNTLLGDLAGSSNQTGANNTIIGSNADLGSSSLQNATAIGANALVSQSNSLVLGNNANIGIGTSIPTQRLHVVGNGLFTGNVTVNGTLNATLPAGSSSYIQNTTNTQPASNFNISGNGTAAGTVSANIVNATNQYNIGGNRVFSVQGFFNTFAGANAGQANTIGSENSFFGRGAGLSNINGNQNSFFGESAGSLSTSGGQNSFFGARSGAANTGIQNSFFGMSSGQANTSGGQNVFVGSGAGQSNTAGSNNTFVGSGAGSGLTTETENTFLGSNSFGSAGITNATAIGSQARVDASNSLVLGGISGINNGRNTNVGIGTSAPSVSLEVRRNSAVATDWQTGQLRVSGATNTNMQLSLGYDTSFNLGVIQAGEANIGFKTLSLNPLGGRIGIGTLSPDQTFSVNGTASKVGGGSWLTFSDERLKNIKGRFTPGLAAVMRLQPLLYQYKPDNSLGLKSDGDYFGFSAQAVEKIIPEAVTKNEQGYRLINNDPILLAMLNAIKEQQTNIEAQQMRIDQQYKTIAALEATICELKPTANICKGRRD